MAISVLLAVLFGPESTWPQAATNKAPREPACLVQHDELEVLRSYLREGSTSPQVVVTTTEVLQADVDSLNLQLAARGLGIPSDVRADFKEKNKSACAITPFAGIAKVRFISPKEYDAIFRAGWAEFHKKFGKDAEVLRLSRVGFNSDKTLALIHVSGGIDRMAGGGALYLLERTTNTWVIKSHIQTWAT
jgi:hypothetical protein